MKSNKTQLLIPVENQVRELDPKLLLAYVAADRGYESVLGPRREMHLHLNTFSKRSIYLSKSTTTASIKVFRILHKLGHEIIAWDEEALVHPPDDVYFSRRLNPIALEYVSCLLAWGQENADLWNRYPNLPSSAEIFITGNPRGDMLRKKMRGFYAKEVSELRSKYGDFILVNTNFNHVNGFVPVLNLIYNNNSPDSQPKFGRAAKGMSREYAEGLRNHKYSVFEEFKLLIPLLHDHFRNHTIIVRPHPTENQEVYLKIAKKFERVKVNNEGYIVPWLIAAKVLIHNGCTTGVEAYAIGTPSISYRAKVNDIYDLGFYRLPNLLSHQCFSFDQLQDVLRKVLKGDIFGIQEDEKRQIFGKYLDAQDGSLACERILNVVDAMIPKMISKQTPSVIDTLLGNLETIRRRVGKRLKEYLPGYLHNSPEFQRHRYPGVSLEEMNEKIFRFSRLLGKNEQPRVRQIHNQFFLIGG